MPYCSIRILAHGLYCSSKNFFQMYLNHRKQKSISLYHLAFKQKVCIIISFSFWQKIIKDVSQGSILGPILCYIQMYHIFDASIGNYKLYWWSTPYTASKMVADIINSLEKCVSIPFRWFVGNFMKINSDKSLLLISWETV